MANDMKVKNPHPKGGALYLAPHRGISANLTQITQTSP